MRSYIVKPSTTRLSTINDREGSLAAFSFRYVPVKNSSTKELSLLLDKNIKGFEPGSSEYINFSKNYFVRISELDDLSFSFGITKDTNRIRPVQKATYKNKTIHKGDLCYQTASNVGNVCFYNEDATAFFNSHIRRLEFKDERQKYYIFAILKSAFGKNQVDVSGSIKGVDNFREENLLNTKIPFPTKNNNPEPQNIENLVSLITQNILDKEEQIKLKNLKIDELIEKELKENQKMGTFEFRLPKISEIRNETRIDTGLYEKKYREIVYLIDAYKNNHFDLLDKYTAKRGQNLQITNIGLSIYSDVEKPNFYRLMTNIELTDQRTVSKFRWLGSGKKLTLIPKNTIFLSADGTVGRCMYITDLGKTITNIHPWIINRKKIGVNQIEDIFTAMFLGWLYKQGFYEKVKDKANGGGIKYNHLERYLKIPNFPESKQKEVAKEYYNPIEQSYDLNFENYLEKEKVRNVEAGIFQLNMELFSLRDKLEDLVDKIVKEEKIDISFNY